MQIEKHDKSYIVKLENGSSWRIWPGDIALTLGWSPTTVLEVLACPASPTIVEERLIGKARIARFVGDLGPWALQWAPKADVECYDRPGSPQRERDVASNITAALPTGDASHSFSS
jgi:hypothetical protein